MTTETPPSRAVRLHLRARAHVIAARLGLQHFHRLVAMLLATATLIIAVITLS
jgi:hypothetical protein